MSKIPTGWTHVGFVLVWTSVPFFVLALCIPVFAAGHWIVGLLIVFLTTYAFVRHVMWIGKRARRGLVRRR